MSTSTERSPAKRPGRGTVALARLTWFVFGPMALAFLAFFIVESGSGWTTALDAAFVAVIGLMLLARWYELRSGLGQDGYGHPATLAAFPRYAAWTACCQTWWNGWACPSWKWWRAD